MDTKVHYRVYNSASLDPILSQMNPTCTLISYSFKIHKLTSYLHLKPSKWSLPLRFSESNFVHIRNVFHAFYASRPLYPIGLITIIIFSEEYKLWSSSLWNFSPSCCCFFLLRSKYPPPPGTGVAQSIYWLGYGLDDHQGLGIFLFATASRPATGPS